MIEGQKISSPMTSTTVEQVMSRLVETAKVDAVFGQPVERGDNIVVPCAEMSIGLGFGFGSGSGPNDGQVNSGGGGVGGGGGARGRPVAAIIISQEGVRVEPILDLTKIVLASFTTAAFVLFWLARLGRATRDSSGPPSFSQFRKAIED